MRIAREALPFALPPTVAAFGCALLGYQSWAIALLLALLLVLYFFRDPTRHFEGPPELVLSPADGTVARIDMVTDPGLAEIAGDDGRALRIVTFLSVFNVHLQRCPCEGKVLGGHYTTGGANAGDSDDDAVTEGYLTVIQRNDGDLVGVRQVVGMVARRIVPYLTQRQQVARGEHLGLIKFGRPRVDLFLPTSYEALVQAGDRLQGGTTPVAMPTDPSSHPLS